jgi:2-haloacid dehalogenase
VSLSRRDFLGGGVAGASIAALGLNGSATAGPARCKAIAFDGFAIINPGPVAALVGELFPQHAEQLISTWRTRQFEYTWLRTVAGQYADFWQVTEESLRFAAASLQLTLTDQLCNRLMSTFLELTAWPDVLPALQRLKAAGIRMAFLANLTGPMLDAAEANSGLHGFFEEHLSTDRVQAYKPDPRAYRMGVNAFGCRRQEIVFAASAGWDAAGAKWFGYRTFWINRSRMPAEVLGAKADAMGSDTVELAEFVLGA